MDYITYRRLAPRTMADVQDSYDEIDFKFLNDTLNELHCVMGLVTEIQEFWEGFFDNDFVNMQEEIGDAFWYMANLENIRMIPLRQLEDRIVVDSEMGLTDLVGELLDVYKKKIFYRTLKHDEKINKYIRAIKAGLIDACIEYQFDLPKILETNINKLKARYPEKFTTEKADNRDLDNERKILEE